jgi:prepilin-type N-terminal cleavage/methylation domain-containing protein
MPSPTQPRPNAANPITPRPAPPGPAAPGFTLVETLIALTVILFCFMGALAMQSGALRSGTVVELQTMAVFLAEAKIEEYRNIPDTGVPDGTPVTDYIDRQGKKLEPSEADQAFFTRVVTLKKQCPTQFNNELTVSVSWPRAQPVVYTSVLPAAK